MAAPADLARQGLAASYDERLQDFLDFVLGEYVKVGEVELDPEKLSELVELKYGTVGDAQNRFGGMAPIRDAFLGFQRHLYER
jgi:type I restriction enzyme R subunit